MKMIFDNISGLNTVEKQFLIRKWLLCHIIVLNKNKPQQILFKAHRITLKDRGKPGRIYAKMLPRVVFYSAPLHISLFS